MKQKSSRKPGKFYKKFNYMYNLVPPQQASSTKELRALFLKSLDNTLKVAQADIRDKGILTVELRLHRNEKIEVTGYIPMSESEKQKLRKKDRESRKQLKDQRAEDRSNAFDEYTRLKEKYKFD